MAPVTAPLSPHPGRLFPADPVVRPVARQLYAAVRELPIVSPHGHRLDAGFLSRLVTEHRLDEDEALDCLVAVVTDQPRKVFKL